MLAIWLGPNNSMGTNCAPLVADLFLFCYERDFMLSLSDYNQTDIIEAFNSYSRYLDDSPDCRFISVLLWEGLDGASFWW